MAVPIQKMSFRLIHLMPKSSTTAFHSPQSIRQFRKHMAGFPDRKSWRRSMEKFPRNPGDAQNTEAVRYPSVRNRAIAGSSANESIISVRHRVRDKIGRASCRERVSHQV